MKLEHVIFCRKCRVFMELGAYNWMEGHFDGPYLYEKTERTDSDYALRCFLETHRHHNIGFASDFEIDDIYLSDFKEVLPTDFFCSVFKSSPRKAVYRHEDFAMLFEKILIIVDVYDWAWDIASRGLLKALPEVEGRIVDLLDFGKMDFHPEDWDMVFIYPWFSKDAMSRLDPSNTIVCVAGGEQLEMGRDFGVNCRDFVVYGACNKEIQRVLRKRFPKRWIPLLSHGVDTEKFKPNPVPHDEFTVGWVGAARRKSKRMWFAEQIVAEAGMKLKVAGYGREETYVSHDEMPEFYGSIDVLLITSECEAHPLIAYEAMSCGVPVVSSNVGDLAETIENGENGFLFDPVDQEKGFPIALKLLRDSKELRRSMGQKAREAVLLKWKWEDIADQYRLLSGENRMASGCGSGFVQQLDIEIKPYEYKRASGLMTVKKYREARERDAREGCLVTFIMPVVSRVNATKTTVEGIMKHANFPHLFKAIVHPDLVKFKAWLERRGITVESAFYFPIVKAKDAMVQLCDTKYLFMFDNDLPPITPLKPMLDFMEANPRVGVCATAMEGSSTHGLLHYGCMFGIDSNRRWLVQPQQKRLPYKYVDYVHHGATMFRMEVFKNVAYDTSYPGQGNEHEDLFMQIADTEWDVVNYNACATEILHVPPSIDYAMLRSKASDLSYEYFREKWNVISKGVGLVE